VHALGFADMYYEGVTSICVLVFVFKCSAFAMLFVLSNAETSLWSMWTSLLLLEQIHE